MRKKAYSAVVVQKSNEIRVTDVLVGQKTYLRRGAMVTFTENGGVGIKIVANARTISKVPVSISGLT